MCLTLMGPEKHKLLTDSRILHTCLSRDYASMCLKPLKLSLVQTASAFIKTIMTDEMIMRSAQMLPGRI